jgi:subtilase family serine protease/flagellar hook assembly protein FlgD
MNARASILGATTLLLAALGSPAAAAVPATASRSGCIEWRIQPVTPKIGAPKSVVGMVDIGNVTVVDLAGSYARTEALPRQEIAQAFLQGRGDDYDFLVVFTTFEFDSGDALAFYNPLRNEVRGIGLPAFDNGAAYGSAGRLQGIVDMAAMSRHVFDPADPRHLSLQNTLAHELMHRWAVGVRFRTAAGADSGDLIGRDGSHWSFFVDSDGSVMYGNDWQPLPGNRFRSVRVRHQYAPLDLYLGGFIAASEVAPIVLLRGAAGNAADLPALGEEISAVAENVSVSQIVAAEGPREPSAADSPKAFRAGLLLLKRPGEALSPQMLAQLERLRTSFQQRFTAMTGGRGTLRFGSLPRRASVPGLPEIVQPSAPRGDEAQVAAGLAWLRSQQHADGRFEDDPATTLRDTAYAIMALSELAPGDPAIDGARTFLSLAPVATLEDHAWRAAGLPADRALALAAIDGLGGAEGFRLARGLEPGVLDTQVAVGLLGLEDPSPGRWQWYVQHSEAAQGGDGRFGVYTGGRGSLRSTTFAIANLALVDPVGSQSMVVRQRAVDWLLAQQAPDGGFGSSLSESLELFSRQPLIRLPEPPFVRLRGWVRGRQGVAGDFGGSVYATSLAMLALSRDGSPNLAVVGLPRFDPQQAIEGAVVRVSAIIENRGGGSAAGSVARFYDGPPDDGGSPIGGAVAIPALDVGARSSATVLFDTRGRAGQRVIHVVADAANEVSESSESDNSASATLAVGPSPAGVELLLSADEAIVTPPRIERAPVEVVVNGILRNLGNASADAVLLRAQVEGPEPQVVAEATVDVAGRSNAPFELRFTRVAATGFRLRIEADADARFTEANESDNVILREVAAGQGVDLVVPADGLVQLGAEAIAGRPVRFRAAVENRGASDSPPATFAATILVDGERVALPPQLVQVAAGGRETREFGWTPTAAGSAVLEVEVDPAGAVAELDEGNNRGSLAFDVGTASGVNLAIVDARIDLSPATPREGAPLGAAFQVRNLGADASPPTVAALYDGDPRLAGRELARAALPGIPAGGVHPVELTVATLALRGDTTFYVAADAEQDVPESDESDNFALRTVPVLGLADLAVALSDIEIEPSQPVLGEPLTATLRVRNLGQQPAGPFVVTLSELGSGAATIAPDRSVAGLAPGAVAELEWTWTLGLVAAPRAIRVEIDSADTVAETQDGNNVLELPLSLQDGTVFASQRWFSPNGDGVRDSVRVAWRLPVAELVQVDVRNASGRVVRRFPPAALARGEFTWDGRNDRGRLVPDGDYRVEIRGNAGRRIGLLDATVDTNRSTAVEAIDTPRSRLVALPPAIPPNGGGWRFGPRGSATRFAVFSRAARPPPGVSPPRFVGLYRSDVLFPALQPVLSQEWLQRYAATRGYYSAEVKDFWFLPDGQRIVFQLRLEIPFGAIHYQFGTIRADVVDNPTLLGAPQEFAGGFAPFVESVLDERTLVVQWPVPGGLERRLLDLQSGAGTAFAPDLPLDAQVMRAVAGGVVFREAQVYDERWRLVPRPSGATRDLGTWRGAVLSPDGRALAGIREVDAEQSVWLTPLDGAPLRQLAGIARQPFEFAADDRRYPDQLTMAWIARAGELLVIDASAPRALSFSNAGESLGSIVLPVQHGPVEGLDPETLWVGSANSVYLGRGGRPTTEGCEGAATWLAERPVHQWFDAANETLSLSIGRTLAIRRRNSETDELVPDLVESGLAYLDLDLFEGGAATGDGLAPAWMFADGSRINCDGTLWSAGGERLRERWALASSVLDVAPGESTLLLGPADGAAGAQTGGRVLGSFLNLPVVLRAENVGRAIRLHGLVADRQFERWELDWSTAAAATQWQSVTSASDAEVFLDDFLYWTPPEPGTYLVRLRAFDRAGNVESATVQVVSQFSADLGRVDVVPRAVSPNGDGVQDEARVDYVVRRATTVRISILDASSTALRTFVRVVGEGGLGPASWTWDGRRDDGSMVPDGRYFLWINEQRFPLLVDTQAPAGEPLLDSPFEASNGRNAALRLAPSGRPAVSDPNLSQLALEYANGGDWQVLRDIAVGSPTIEVALEEYAGRSFRLRAVDLAGNRTLFPLGQAREELTLVARAGLWRASTPAGRPRLERSDLQGNRLPFTTPPDRGTPYLLAEDPDLDVLEVSTTASDLVEIEYQTAPLAAEPAWQVRERVGVDADGVATCARIDVAVDRCPLDGSTRHWKYVRPAADPLSVAERRPFIARAVGLRADGSRLASNWVRFDAEGLGAEMACATLPPGRDTLVPATVRERLLQDAGISPAAVTTAMRFVGFDLPPPDGLRSIRRTDIETVIGGATVLARERAAALVELSPPAMAAVQAAEQQQRKATAVIRVEANLQGLRALASEVPVCIAIQNAIGVAARIEPLLGAECAAMPSGAVQLALGTTGAGPGASLRRIVVAVRDPATGSELPVLDRSYAPAITLGPIGSSPLQLDIDTSALPLGSMDAMVRIDRGQGLESLPAMRFAVDRTSGSASISQPAAGARVCASRQVPEAPLSVPISGAVDGGDPGVTWHVVGAGEGASPVAWQENERVETGPVNGVLGAVVVQRGGPVDPFLINGNATLRVRAWDWSGAQVCGTQTVVVDATLDAEEGPGELPGPVVETISTGVVLGLSGRGRFQRIALPFRLGERVDFTLTLHALTQPEEPGSALVETPIATVQDGFADPPAMRLTWDGALGGTPLAEGAYGLRLDLRDACGFSRRFEYRLRVDRTAPAVSITQPSAGASVGGLRVEVRGTVGDPRLSRWQVLAGSAAAGSVLAPVETGNGPVPTATRLADWARGSLSGPAIIALVAEDVLDNIARVDVPIVLGAPSQLVASGSVSPPLFSPNGDGIRDSARLEAVLARAVRATVRVVDDGGVLLRTLASDVNLPAGAAAWTWDGRAGGAGAVVDGSYRFELQVADAAQPASAETQVFAVGVDSTPPLLRPLTGDATFVPGGRALGIAIEEARLERYEVELRRGADGVVVARAAGVDAVEAILSNSDLVAEAAHRLVGTATDRAGNSAAMDHRFTIDRTAPVLEFATPAVDAVLARGASTAVAGAVDDANLDRWDLRLARAGSSPLPLSSGTAPIAPGGAIHTWSVQQPEGAVRLVLAATDRAGNTATLERPLVIDGTPPVAVLTRPSAGAAIQRLLEVDGTAADTNFLAYRIALAPASGASAGQFSELFEGEVPVVAGRLFDAMLSRPEGEYQLRLTVEDRAGQSSTATVALRIDTEPPPPPTGLTATTVANRDVALDWNDVDAPDLAHYRIHRNGVALAVAPTASAFRDESAPEGRLRYTVSALDRAGNESPQSTPATVVLDRTPPSLALTQPLDGDSVAGVVDLRGSVRGQEDLASWRVLVVAEPGGSATVLAEGVQERDDAVIAQWDTRDLSDLSSHRVVLEAVDLVGNAASATARVLVDNGAPSPPAALTAEIDGNDVSLDWPPNPEPDLLGYLVYRDGVLLSAVGTPPQDLRPYAIAADAWLDVDVGDGTRRYRVRAIDRAGNASEPSPEAVVELDNAPPRLTLVEPLPDQRFDRTIRVRAQSADVDIAEVAFAWRAPGGPWTPIGASLSAPPWTVEWSPQGLPFGNYEVRALARDSGGREDPEPPIVAVRFADLTPPEPPSEVRSRADGLRIRTAWQASPSGDVALYRVHRGAGLGPLLAELPAGARDHEGDALGAWDVVRTVVAVDAEGNVSAIPPPGQARIFTPSLVEPFTPVAASSLTLEGASPTGGTAMLSVVSPAGSVDVGPVVIAADGRFEFGGAPLAAGENRLDVRVTDADGNRSLAVGTWVDRAILPQAPENVATALVDRNVTLSWTPRPAGEAIGYRVFRNQGPVLGDADTPLLTATSSNLFQPSRAIDNDPATFVEVPPGFDGRFDFPRVIELRAPAMESLVGLRLAASDGAHRIVAADVEAWSGRRWVRVAGFADNVESERFVPFEIVYRTQRVRLLVHRVPPLVGGEISELDLVRRPMVAGPPVEQSLPDGQHRFRVAAVERFAFEGPGADAAPVEVGDAQPPEPVVLTGSVQGSDAVLQWTASASTDVAAYIVRRDGAEIARVAATAERRHVDADRPNGSYDYTLVAVDAFDNASAPSNVVRLAIAADLPGAPQWIALQALPEGRAVQLQWQPGSGAPAFDFVVDRSDDDAPFVTVATQAATGYRDGSLIDGRTYRYRLAARDRAGNRGPPSEVRTIVPRDSRAPAAPVLNLPLPPGSTYATDATVVGVCGMAEPNAHIELRSDRGRTAQAQAASGWALRSFVPGLQAGEGTAVANDGRLLFVSEFGRGAEVHDLDTGRLIGRWQGSARLATVSADSRTLWFVDHSTSVLRRLDLGTLAAGVESEEFESMQALHAAPDGRRLLLHGRRTSETVDAVWLLDVRTGALQRLGDLDAFLPPRSIFWSPDGSRVLATEPVSGTAIVFGLDGTRQDTLIDAGVAPAQWLPDGRHVLVLQQAGNGSRLSEVELGTGEAVVRLQFPLPVDAFVVDPGGRFVALQTAERVDVVELATGAILATWPTADLAAWTRGHRLVTVRNEISVVDSPGGFCVRAFPLLAGAQAIQATARDAAGNVGAASASIAVTVGSGALPDLAIAPGDLRAVPASGRIGEAFSALVTIRNRGTAAAPSAPVAVRLSRPSGVQHGLSVQPGGELAAGGARTLEFPLGVLDAAGTWLLHATIDGGNAIVEVDEANNSAQRGIPISADGAPLLEVALRGDLLAPGGILRATVGISNPGPTFNGRLTVSVRDGSGTALEDVLDLPVEGLAFGAVREFPVAWPSLSRAGGAYRLRAVLADATGSPVAAAEVPFAIDGWRVLVVELAVPAGEVVRGTPFTARARIDYRSGNLDLADAVLQMDAIAADGTRVANSLRSLGTLRPGFEAIVPFEIATAPAMVGPMRVVARVAGAGFEAGAERTVLIADGAATPALSGTLELSPDAEVQLGRDARLRWIVRNTGGVALPAVASRLRILGGGGAVEVLVRTASDDLVVGGSAVRDEDLAAASLALGAYRAQLEARLPSDPVGAWRLLASRSLSVTDGEAPAISEVDPDGSRPVAPPVRLRARVVDRHAGLDRVEARVDGGSWLPMSGGVDGRYQRELDALADGSHEFDLRATDRYGNQSQLPARAFVVDGSPPTIVIGGVVDGQVGALEVVPTITITDAHPDPAQDFVRLDGQSYVQGTPVAAEGAHVLFVRALDRAGNRRERSVRFTIDRTPPMLQFLAPANGSATTSAAIDVRIASEPGVRIRLVAGAYVAEELVAAAGEALFAAVPLQFGTNALQAQATDAAGNASPVVGISVVRTDPGGATLQGDLQVAPTVERGDSLAVAVQLRNQTGSPLPAQRFRVRALGPGGSPLLESREFVRDLAAGATATETLSLPTGGWPLGQVALLLDAEMAGAWQQLDSAAVQVADGAAPLLLVLSPAADAVLRNPVRVEANASDPGGAPPSVRARLDLGAWLELVRDPGDASRFARDLLPLAEGGHRLDVEAIDEAGNLTAAPPRLFTVDESPPVITFGGVADGAVSNAASVAPTVAVADAHPATLTATLDGQPWVSGTPVASEGAHRIDAVATDRAGNQALATLRFTLDRTPPTVQFTAPPAGAVVLLDRVTMVGQTEPQAQVRVANGAYSVLLGADADGVFVAADVPLSIGDNPITAEATDLAGNPGPPSTRNIRYLPNAGAVLEATVDVTPAEGEPGVAPRASWTLRNPGSAAVVALPARLTFQRLSAGAAEVVQNFSVSLAPGGSIAGAADLDTVGRPLGSYEAVIEAELTAGDGTTAWTRLDAAPFAIVDRTPPQVSFVAPAPSSVHGAAVAVVVQASDALSAIAQVEARLAGGPWTALVAEAASPGRYGGSLAPLADGATNLEARASDAAGQVGSAAPLAVVIDRVAPVITIGGVPPADPPVNVTVLPTIAVQDATETQVVATLNGQPYVQGTPVTAEGPHWLRVVATDAAGNATEAEARFTIDRTPPVVVIVQPPPGTQTPAPAILVAGNTEPGAAVRVAIGAAQRDVVADSKGAFAAVDLPLSIGSNLVTALARDRAGNQGPEASVVVVRTAPPSVQFQGRIDLVAKIWEAGEPLAVPVSLQNSGTAGAVASRFRLLVQTVDGGVAVTSASIVVDVAAGATVVRQFDFATAAWPQTELRLVLQHDRGTAAAPDWVLLDDHLLALVGSCFQARLFADGFESGATPRLFGDGFESCTGVALPVRLVLAPASQASDAASLVAATWRPQVPPAPPRSLPRLHAMDGPRPPLPPPTRATAGWLAIPPRNAVTTEGRT